MASEFFFLISKKTYKATNWYQIQCTKSSISTVTNIKHMTKSRTMKQLHPYLRDEFTTYNLLSIIVELFKF